MIAEKSESRNSKPAVLDAAVTTTDQLLAYCRANEWAGYDPYDALNSEIFKALPFLDSRIPRLLLTQALKRSPINVRSLMRVPKTQNPKALGLFLSAFLKLAKVQPGRREDVISLMLDRLIALRSADVPHWCWGYSFAWQTRTIVVPRGTPNLVCTIFVANALLDLYQQRRDPQCLEMAVSAAGYIANDLYWDEGGSGAAGFSYPLRSLRGEIHNANFLAAAFLCRVYQYTGEERLVTQALRVARYSAGKQHADGSWFYGESPTQLWVDNFHTGYNLSGLRQIDEYLETHEFQAQIQRGYEFYRKHFFREDGAPRYFHDRTYPIDIHCVAQSIITLLEFKHLDSGSEPLAFAVLDWAQKNMWDERGYFYYRVLRSCKIRTSYMRWSQAWMFLALATLVHDQTPVPMQDTLLAQASH